jgi:hypothetical protein
MSLRLTHTDGSSTMTVPRQRVRKAVAALFAGALLAGGAAALVPANAQAAVDPGVCKMGISLANGYYERGDIRTGNDIIYNLVRMGCADGGAAPAAPALAE